MHVIAPSAANSPAMFLHRHMPRAALKIAGENNLTWYRSSQKVRRGFCATCGSTLFWAPLAEEWIGITMGAFENPTGTKLEMHIFVTDKGDYYEIADSLPQVRG